MNNLSESIASYLNFLKNHAGISISIHFGIDSPWVIPEEHFGKFRQYNTHMNPYCMAVKKQEHHLCVKCQQDIRAACKNEKSFCHVCHAAVLQYIHPLTFGNDTIGFAAVSGYRTSAPSGNIVDLQLWNNYLQPEDPPVRQLEAAAEPLRIMIEELFSKYAIKINDEYDQILRYLNEYHTDVMLDDLCRHFGRSKSHISHLFKQRNGASIHAYCNQLKLEDSRHLLQVSKRSVTEIAMDAGFHDTSYFIRLFREKYGISPYQYRKHLTNED